MDRIEKALQKKRSRRHGNDDAAPAFVENSKYLEDRTEIVHPFEKIVYTQSRVVETPANVLAENRLIAGNRSDPRSVVFRMLRTQVLQKMRENGWTSIAITGPISGVGKSVVATNLAISISLEVNQTVLLVDADLRRPSIHKYFDFEPEYGLIDYLRSEARLEDLFVNPVYKRMLLIPGKGTTSESSELLSSPRMSKLLKDIKSRYQSRIIVFDLPPLLSTDDVIVFMPEVDATLLVVENGKNTKSEVEKSMRLLESTNLIGTVLNKAEEQAQEYY